MNNLEHLKEKYNLANHQIPFFLQGNQLLDFKGKRVLEVGGSLPKELVIDVFGSDQWIGNEQLEYWDEIGENHPTTEIREIKGSSYLSGQRYSILAGNIEDIPASFDGKFDVVFSIAAFEHIAKLPIALDAMHRSLKSGGKLFTIFSPVWSSHDGHHLPDLIDEYGTKYNFANSPIPPWGHLYMTRAELYSYLRNKHSKNFSDTLLYYFYNSPHINRYFFSDYVTLINKSLFSSIEIMPLFPTQIPSDVAERLERKYGMQDFTHNGMMLLLTK